MAAMLQNDAAIGHGRASKWLHHPPKRNALVLKLFHGWRGSHSTVGITSNCWKVSRSASDFGERGRVFKRLGPWNEVHSSFARMANGKQLSASRGTVGRCVDDIGFIHNMVANGRYYHRHLASSDASYALIPRHGKCGQLMGWIDHENLPTFCRVAVSRLCSIRPKELGFRFPAASAQGHQSSATREPDR